jgi:hypothetical protein
VTPTRLDTLRQIAAGGCRVHMRPRGDTYATLKGGERMRMAAVRWLTDERYVRREPAPWGSSACPLTVTDKGQQALAAIEVRRG